MRYALANFTKTISKDGQDLFMEGYSLADRPVSMIVKMSDMNRWLNGESIGIAFPYLTAEQREVCISGIDGIQWNEMFAESEE